jgi:hypothetical protein
MALMQSARWVTFLVITHFLIVCTFTYYVAMAMKSVYHIIVPNSFESSVHFVSRFFPTGPCVETDILPLPQCVRCEKAVLILIFRYI